MKHTLLIITALMLVVGCSKEPINYETTLVERDGVFYTKDTNKPYSGQVFSLYEDGEKKSEGTIKEGKWDGLLTEWYENGQKKQEGTYKEGQQDVFRTYWDNDGSKYVGKVSPSYTQTDGTFLYWYDDQTKIKYYHTYKDGEKDGLSVWWYENGQKKQEGTWKDGELDGKWTGWHENSQFRTQKSNEWNYKDGKLISSKSWDEYGWRNY